jgi:DNA-binding HxlR family transcriptional regulator
MAKSKPAGVRKAKAGPRRSPCPVSCLLDIMGDRWSLLVVRDLMLGGSRFKDFSASPEGIPTNILSERLERLLQHDIIEQMPVGKTAKRLAYRLTAKGKALGPVMAAMRDWGLAWEKGTRTARRAVPTNSHYKSSSM